MGDTMASISTSNDPADLTLSNSTLDVLSIPSQKKNGEADTPAECKKLSTSSATRTPEFLATTRTSWTKPPMKEMRSPSLTPTTCASSTGRSTRRSTATRETTPAGDEAKSTDKSFDLRERSRNSLPTTMAAKL